MKLTGDIVYLRTFEERDIGNKYLDWVNDDKQNPFLLSSRRKSTIKDLEEYFKKNLDDQNSYFFAICDKVTNQHIGNARLYDINRYDSHGVFGWLIGDVDFRSKGCGSDSLIQLLRFGFLELKLNRIYGKVAVFNEAALRSSQKVGMVNEGTCRDSFFANGNYYDAVHLSMLRSEFEDRYGKARFDSS